MKRSANDILNNINPVKSSDRYEAVWKNFIDYINKSERPTEEDLLQYVDYLKHQKGYAVSSIWSKYSMLNHKFQILYGEKLQKFPRLTHLIKSYESGYVRKTSKLFTKEDVWKYLQTAPNSGEHIYLKAALVVGYCGGLRCADLVSINCEDCEFNETTGMWIQYNVSKQRGEAVVNKFNVPLEMCSYLETYDNELDKCNAGSGRMFKTYRTRKDGSGYFTKQAMGVHLLRKVSTKIATYLNLPNPEKYTGHCLRRSTANTLAEAGTSTTILKKHFNWKSEGTALKYVENTKAAKLSISEKMVSNSTARVPNSTACVQSESNKILQVTNCQNIIVNF